MNLIDIAEIIEKFIERSLSPYEWDDFVSIKSTDDTITRVKDYCTSVDFLFPSDHGSGKPYHSEAAFEKLGELAKCLRQGNQATSDWLFNEGF